MKQQNPSSGSNSSSTTKIFPMSYKNTRFITTFTRAHHLSPSSARWIQSITSHPVSLQQILLLISHPFLNLQVASFFQDSYQSNVCISPLPLMCNMSYFHLIFLQFITQIIFGEEHRSWGSSLCSLLQPFPNHYYINTFNKVHNSCSKKTRHKLYKLANKTWHSCQFCQSAPLHTCLYVA